MGDSSQTQTTNSAPWGPQQGYLLQGFQNAQNNYNTELKNGPYSGNYVAPTNQSQYDAATGQYDFSTGQPTTSAIGALLGTGTSNLNGGSSTAAGASGALSDALSGNTADNLVNQAKAIASGYNVPGEVAAAMQPALQTAADSTLPNLYRSAASTGNLNSDRTAVAQGVVDRGLAQTAQNLGAELQNQNFTNSLSTAMSQNGQNISGLTSLGSLGAGLASLGSGDIASGVNTGETAAQDAQTGANALQTLDQSNLNNSIDQYLQNQNFPLQALQTYMSMVGGNYGQQSTQTATKSPSTLGVIGGIGGLLGSLF